MDELNELQQQLLIILKGEQSAQAAWHARAGILGYPPDAGPLPRSMSDVMAIRRRIIELKPDACVYASWGGPMP